MEAAGPSPPPESTRAERAFLRHRLAFLLCNGALTVANVVTGSPWWAFWPLIAWGLALMLHFLFYRATTVEDAWVEERTQDLRAKSYDFAHIDSIREQAERSGIDDERGPSVAGVARKFNRKSR